MILGWVLSSKSVKYVEQILDNVDVFKILSDMMSLLCLLTSGRNLDFILVVAFFIGKFLGLVSKLVKQVIRMWDNSRYRLIIWFNFFDIFLLEMRDVIG